MRVLVTGGNRYIGLSLVFELARRGHEVTVANSHEAPLPAGARRIHVDRRVPGALRDALAPHRDDFDAIFDNTAFTVADVEPMIELFEGRVRHYVFTSSMAVYRRSFVQPVQEHFRTHDPADDDPRKSYGVNKVRCERLLRDRFERTGFPATTLRVSHTIGPRSPLPTREPVYFARLEQGRPIPIPAEGFPFVSLIHVDDAATLMASVLGNDHAPGEIYNATGPEVTSIAGAVHLMAKAVGVEPHLVHVPLEVARHLPRPLVHWGEGIMGGAIFSMDKVRRHLDWTPRFGLEDGYRDAYEWFRTGGREQYEFDFSVDDEVLARLGR
jgi:nucleoside-diphosphate-sugar epimerase